MVTQSRTEYEEEAQRMVELGLTESELEMEDGVRRCLLLFEDTGAYGLVSVDADGEADLLRLGGVEVRECFEDTLIESQEQDIPPLYAEVMAR